MRNSIFKDWNIIKWLFNILMVSATITVLGYCVNIEFAIGYIMMLVVHELGHIMAARAYDVQVRFGGFTPFGAYIQIYDQTSLKENAVIAISGPLCGLITTILYFFVFILIGNQTFLWLSFFTGIVSLMNLMPLDPFDGGKVIQGTFCYLPLFAVPFLGYGAYMMYREHSLLYPFLIAFIVYIILNVVRMRKRNRIDSMLYLEKSPKFMIFIIYIIIILLLVAMLYALFKDYGLSLLPTIQPIVLPSILQTFFDQILR